MGSSGINAVHGECTATRKTRMKLLSSLLLVAVTLFANSQGCIGDSFFSAAGENCPTKTCFATCKSVNFASSENCTYTRPAWPYFWRFTSRTKTCEECYGQKRN